MRGSIPRHSYITKIKQGKYPVCSPNSYIWDIVYFDDGKPHYIETNNKGEIVANIEFATEKQSLEFVQRWFSVLQKVGEIDEPKE